jgi:hypothetical protein
MELQKSEKQKVVGEPPEFKGDGVAVWINKDKNGNQYLSIQICGKNGMKLNAWKYEHKPEK